MYSIEYSYLVLCWKLKGVRRFALVDLLVDSRHKSRVLCKRQFFLWQLREQLQGQGRVPYLLSLKPDLILATVATFASVSSRYINSLQFRRSEKASRFCKLWDVARVAEN